MHGIGRTPGGIRAWMDDLDDGDGKDVSLHPHTIPLTSRSAHLSLSFPSPFPRPVVPSSYL
jgi:hypothetical protein